MRKGVLAGMILGVVVLGGALVYGLTVPGPSADDYFEDAAPAAEQLEHELEPLVSGAKPPTRAYTAWLAGLFLEEDRRLALRVAEDDLDQEAVQMSALSSSIQEAEDALDTIGPTITRYEPPPLTSWSSATDEAAEAAEAGTDYVDAAQELLAAYDDLISFQRRLVGESDTTFAILWTGLPQAVGDTQRSKRLLEGIVPRLKMSVERLEAMDPPPVSEEAHSLSLEATKLTYRHHRQLQRLEDPGDGASQSMQLAYTAAIAELISAARRAEESSPIFAKRDAVLEAGERLTAALQR